MDYMSEKEATLKREKEYNSNGYIDYVYHNPSFNCLKFDEDYFPEYEHVSFVEAMSISPTQLAYAESGRTLIFSDMEIKIVTNNKHYVTNKEQEDRYRERATLDTADKVYKDFMRKYSKLKIGEATKLISYIIEAFTKRRRS